MPQSRDKAGRFVKGVSGNPGGRLKLPPELKEMAKAAAPRALEVAIEIMNNNVSEDADRLRAANIVLERAYGKPGQEIQAALNFESNFVLRVSGEGEDDADADA